MAKMMNETSKHLLANDEVLLEEMPGTHRRSGQNSSAWPIIAFLLASNLVFAFGWAATIQRHARQDQSSSSSLTASHNISTSPPQHIPKVPDLPQRPVQFHWYTAYSSPNDTSADQLWNNINTAHGSIAVDHQLAAQQNWPPSMSVPGNESKGLYLLESYHQLHCLKIVRKLFFESQAGSPLSYPVQHVRHCFDAFRQFVMCHADNSPLYTRGQHTSGDGQWHMCPDWSALRAYATEHSACFRDRVGKETLAEQFGRCDDAGDGDGLLLDAEELDLSDVVPM